MFQCFIVSMFRVRVFPGSNVYGLIIVGEYTARVWHGVTLRIPWSYMLDSHPIVRYISGITQVYVVRNCEKKIK